MGQTFQNSFLITQDWGLYIGSSEHEPAMHKNFLISFLIRLGDPVELMALERTYTVDNAVVTHPGLELAMSCSGMKALFQINPISTLGCYFKKLIGEGGIHFLDTEYVQDLRDLSNQFIEGHLTNAAYVEQVTSRMTALASAVEHTLHWNDARIQKAVQFLYENLEEDLSAQSVAEHCALSESRFLHLFKKETGSTFRKAKLWFRFLKAFPLLFKQSITETAHQVGFTDSAHFSKAFRENFGATPSELVKNSQFLQA